MSEYVTEELVQQVKESRANLKKPRFFLLTYINKIRKDKIFVTTMIMTMLLFSSIFMMFFWSAFASPTGRVIIDVNSLGEGSFEFVFFTIIFLFQLGYMCYHLWIITTTTKERIFWYALFIFLMFFPAIFFLVTNERLAK